MRIYPVVVRPRSGGAAATEAFTDAFALKIAIDDTTGVPTDAAAFNIALLQGDTNDVQTETVALGSFYDDTNVAPTEANSFTLRCWLSGSAGAGVTNPSNADGQNDAATAQLATSLAGASTITMTSTLGANVPTATITSAVYRGWFSSANILVTSIGRITLRSTSALFADVDIFTNAGTNSNINHLSGSFTYDLIANGINTIAKIQSIQVLHRVADAVAGVTQHVLTVDAGCIELAGAFT